VLAPTALCQAKGTFTVEFSSIMTIVWKRLKDKTNEHHAFKCLVLLEFLLQHGNHEMVLSQVQNNLHHIQGVTSFSLKNAVCRMPHRARTVDKLTPG
jgi:hypothetical protein|tara:strand:- start:80 stop:370 length:291 start_codon:yes stop_codon:yes gene_type:complete